MLELINSLVVMKNLNAILKEGINGNGYDRGTLDVDINTKYGFIVFFKESRTFGSVSVIAVNDFEFEYLNEMDEDLTIEKFGCNPEKLKVGESCYSKYEMSHFMRIW